MDNHLYGIQMKLYDFDDRPTMSTFLGTNSGGVGTKLVQGILSSSMPIDPETGMPTPDGYPTIARQNDDAGAANPHYGASLSDFFGQGISAQDVNHLFIKSTYEATGYYEFDSAQNYAALQPDGNFRVYQELGTYDSAGSRPTLKHGQFFPLNDIRAGHFASVNGRNLYSATAKPLDEDDPRRNELLYLIDDVNCYFGVELTASFIQTPNGLDDWGHDIIFEFSGDDDFWLYVDGELVIDLGGIHSAVPGSVNFRTGDVSVNGKPTTLRALFAKNYKTRNPEASDAEVEAYLGNYFKPNSSVFIDGTKHTMRIFYLERGAGASNLNMRFNLASVKKGAVQLSKELDLSGTDTSATPQVMFPYQIWFKVPAGDEAGTWKQLTSRVHGATVLYKDSTNKVPYSNVIYVDHFDEATGKTYAVRYEGVYYLEPGETAEITFPVYGTTGAEVFVDEYYLVECGVDPEIYENVSANGYSAVPAAQDPHDSKTPTYSEAKAYGYISDGHIIPYPEGEEPDSGLRDYRIPIDTTEQRATVGYVNKPKATNALTIQKELYRKEGENRTLVKLYDDDGNLILIPGQPPYDESGKLNEEYYPDLGRVFGFRLYFKKQFEPDDPDDPTQTEDPDDDTIPIDETTNWVGANMYVYHVKDPAGYYCIWNRNLGRFVRIIDEPPYYVAYPGQYGKEGITSFNNIPDVSIEVGPNESYSLKSLATFKTSMNGSISDIPAYYYVEVPGLLPGTDFLVVERNTETPDGYQFWQYALENEAVEHPVEWNNWKGVAGSIATDANSAVQVRNDKGYLLRITKEWADKQNVRDREPAFFALYYETADETGAVTRQLVPGTLKMLPYAADPQRLSWSFLYLPLADTVFANYAVYEVALENPVFTYDDDGNPTLVSYELRACPGGQCREPARHQHLRT